MNAISHISGGRPMSEEGRPSLTTFIVRMSAYRPGHSFLRFVMWLFTQNVELLVGLLEKAYLNALDSTVQPTGLATLPVPAIVALLALEGLLEMPAIVGLCLSTGSLGFRQSALLWHNVFNRIFELPGARALAADRLSGDAPDGAQSSDAQSSGASSSVGQVLSTLRDDADVLEGIADLPSDVVLMALQLALKLVVLLAVDVQVTLWMFLPLTVVWSLGYLLRGRAERLRAASREASAAYSGALGEALTLVQAIQVAGAESGAVAHLRRRGAARQEAALREGLYESLIQFISWGWGGVLFAVLLLVTGPKMRAGTFSVGDLALFILCLSDLSHFVGWGVDSVVYVRQGRVSMERMLALMQGAPLERLVVRRQIPLRKAPSPQPSPVQPTGEGAASSSPPWAVHPTAWGRRGLRGGTGLQTLQVKGLTVCHPGAGPDENDNLAGIEDVSFELARGMLTVVVGRVGAGKSTLLRALLGLLPLDGGQIRWNGELVDDPATFMQPPRAGYTPQVPGLLSATLRENVLLDWPATDDQVDRAVHDAVLERDVAEFPEGLDTLIGVRGRRLSGGQVQRTALARMLIRQPELLVMDDVSSALDVETEQLLWQRLLGRGAVLAPGGLEDPAPTERTPDGRDDPAPAAYVPTCLVVSHRRTVLERADQILLMEGGRITDRGTLQELLARSPEMRRLCAEQEVD